MTLYTKYRGYPYPRDAKEAGNGGLHSQLLAEAIARDLDTLDAAWLGEQQRPTLMVTKSGDMTGVASGIGGANTVSPWAAEKVQGVTMTNTATPSAFRPAPGGEGWYHVLLTLRSKASGTITANALHRAGLRLYKLNTAGNLDEVETLWTQTFQSGSADCYNELQTVFYLDTTRELRVMFQHLNTGSTVTVVGSGTGGTRLTLTRIVSD